jgi:hypothetical protein
MRPKRRRGAPQGLRHVAKRVPSVQQSPRGRVSICSVVHKAPFIPAPACARVNSSGNPGQRWVPAFVGTNGGENLEAQPLKTETLFGSRAPAHISQPRAGIPQTESRRVGTRRLPYVGDRVGGLGVRPPALGSVCGDYRRCPPGCSISIPPPSVRCGPQWCIPSPSRPRNPPRFGPVTRLSIAKRRF